MNRAKAVYGEKSILNCAKLPRKSNTKEEEQTNALAYNQLINALGELQDGEELVWWDRGQSFIISRATEDDIERIGSGFFCLD